MNTFFSGVWRLDLGFGNPNKTAAFVAILMIAVWGFAYVRRWGFWVSLGMFVGLGIALVHTFSRGGLMALLAGSVPLLIWAPRPWRYGRSISLAAGILILAIASFHLKAPLRYAQGIASEDPSISNRLRLWKAAPAMIRDAPEGWGIGRSGVAYMQWYQPREQNEVYRTLVNSHLTWLVEFGWPLRGLYIFGWCAIFLWCWPPSPARWRVLPLGVWIALFVAALFSSVAEAPAMWIVPGLFLIAIIVDRIIHRRLPSSRSWAGCVLASILIAFCLFAAGSPSPLIRGTPQSVVFGYGQPAVWVLYNAATMGDLYGKSIRSSYDPKSSPRAMGVWLDESTLPDLKGKTLVLGGNFPKSLQSRVSKAVAECDHLILLNPGFPPSEIGIEQTEMSKIHTYFGEFCQSPYTNSWPSFSTTAPLPGNADFVPNWPAVVSRVLASGR